MSAAAIAERPDTSEIGTSSGGVIVRPQITGIAAEQQRATAEIQAALTVAKHSRRDEVDAVDRIKTACQRVRLAEGAEYVYDRGGTEITGPTIDLLTVIANCWGNIQFGFRELTQGHGESTVEAFAWDLETNSKSVKVFTVPHKRVTRKGTTNLTDPRDIYELVANQAQRRVRACLEAIIPPDVVEDAVAQCRATLKETAKVTPESIGQMVEAFGKLGVSKDQLQVRLGRRLDAMQPAQLVNLRRIYKSITDGMSKPADWFEVAETEGPQKSATESAKDALKKRASQKAEEAASEPPLQDEPAVNQDLHDFAAMELKNAENYGDVESLKASLLRKAETDADRAMVTGLCDKRREEIRNGRGERSNKKEAAGT